MKKYIFEIYLRYAQKHKLQLCSLSVLHFLAASIQVPRKGGTKKRISIKKAVISQIKDSLTKKEK